MSTQKRCIVTGAAGFIGSHLCEALIEQGHAVYGIDNLATGRLENVAHLNNNKFFFTKRNVLGYIASAKNIDWLFHLAARADVVPSIEDPGLYHDMNVTATQRMLELARRSGVKKFIYAASSSCYGDKPITPTTEDAAINPRYPYALTKWMGEKYVLHWEKIYKMKTISLRLFNVYGPRARTSGAYGAVFGTFLSQLANGKPLTVIGDGEQKRDFVWVGDVAKAFIKAAESETTGIYNIGSGQAYSINYLASLLGGQVEYLPDRPGEPRTTHANITKASQELNWGPEMSFEAGVSVMLSQAQSFKNAPLWDKESIAKATKTWFEYMG